MDFAQKWKVKLDDLDLLTMKSYLVSPGERSKLIWDINRDSNKYYEVEILPEHSREENYELTKCCICDIDIPNKFKNQHEKSNKHFMNLKIINIALKRMANHNENSIQDSQLTSIHFCAICSKVINNTEDHESSFEHQQFLQYDLVLKYFLSVYEDKNKINDVITEFNLNFAKKFKNDENSNSFCEDMNLKPWQLYLKNKNNVNIDVTVINDKLIRINTENSTLECGVNNFHGLNHIRGHVQCKVCREVITNVEEHINSDRHRTKISVDLVKCCLRKIDTLYHHCVLCNEVIIDVEDHLLEDEHKALFKENYTTNVEKNYMNSEGTNVYDIKNKTILHSKDDDKLTDTKSVCTSSDINEIEDIIRRDNSLYCKFCDVCIIGEDNDKYVHLNSEKHKYAVTNWNKNEAEILAVNVNVSENNTRVFYEDFFETRLGKLFCNLCNIIENDTITHKTKKKHITKYKKFLQKYNVSVHSGEHFCNKCNVFVKRNFLSNHILIHHDKDIFNEKVTDTNINEQFKITDNVNKLWCKPCRTFIDNKRWFVYYHRNTVSHSNKLSDFYQEHSICQKNYQNTKKKKNYCQACNSFLRLSKIMRHIDSLSHVENIKKYSFDSIEINGESKTIGYEKKISIDISDSDNDSYGIIEKINTIIFTGENVASINLDEAKTTVCSTKRPSLPNASTTDDGNDADHGFESQLTSDERVTDNVPSALVCATSSASSGAWAKPLQIRNTEIKKGKLNVKPASLTDIVNDEANTTVGSIKRQSLPNASTTADRNDAYREFESQLTSDERVTDNVPSALVCATSSASSGAWAKPLQIRNTEIKKGKLNVKPASLIDIVNDEANTTVGSIKRQSLPNASTTADRNDADREFESQLTSDERVTDNFPSALVCATSSASSGAWAKPLQIRNTEIKKGKLNVKPASLTDIVNDEANTTVGSIKRQSLPNASTTADRNDAYREFESQLTSDERVTDNVPSALVCATSSASSGAWAKPLQIRNTEIKKGKLNVKPASLIDIVNDEANTTVGSIKRQSLPNASTTADRNDADREFESQLTSDERVTDNFPSALVCATSSASLGAWAKPLQIRNTEIKKGKLNIEPASLTDILNIVVDDYCKVCLVKISNSPVNIVEHNKGKSHITNLEKIMLDNNLKNDNGTLFCGFCLVSVEDVINHVSSDSHHNKMVGRNSFNNPSTMLQDIPGSLDRVVIDESKDCFVPTPVSALVYCVYCYLNVFSRDDLRKVHMKDEIHKTRKEIILADNYVRKLHDKYHCALCLDEFEFGTAINHMNYYKHVEQYEMKYKFTIHNDYMKNNNFIKHSEGKVLCQACRVVLPNIISKLFDHVDSVRHEFFNILMPDIENVLKQVMRDQSTNDSKNAAIFYHAQFSQSNEASQNEETDKNLPQNKEHKKEFERDNNYMFYCDICSKKFQNDLTYDNHETSRRHKEKLQKIIEDHSFKIKNDLICYCELCDLYFNKISVTKHIKSLTHQWQWRNHKKN